MNEIFVPHKLQTIEVDVEKKIFRVNGEDFGQHCTGFTITCNGCNSFDIRMEINSTVQFATYKGIDRTSFSEHPVRDSWYEGHEDGDKGK